jgi:predicted amidophosphoribosyltransferase
LVDDVISTWTTVNEISKILKQNWAKKVITLTIASGY